ncbi:MAG: hypothetical protein JOZ29_14715, partial [Deltaproteobacteria bacterium]|nr:hypothetical protein [Deltaproteobacteria bacterium]
MRPTGVVLIAIYHLLTAAFLLLLGIAFLVGGSLLGAILGNNIDVQMGSRIGGAGIGFFIGLLAAIFLFGFALVALLAGYGLWAMREWGRILNIILATIALLFALPGVMFMLMPMHAFMGGFFFGGFGLIRIAISAAIIWYLIQPQVRVQFQ